MVEQIYLTLEITAFALCVHTVFGRKFQFRLSELVGILVFVMSKSALNECEKGEDYFWIIYIELLIYCWLQLCYLYYT